MITCSKYPNFLSQSLTVVTSCEKVPLNSDRDQIVAVVPRYTEYKRNFMGENPRQGSSSNSCFFFLRYALNKLTLNRYNFFLIFVAAYIHLNTIDRTWMFRHWYKARGMFELFF